MSKSRISRLWMQIALPSAALALLVIAVLTWLLHQSQERAATETLDGYGELVGRLTLASLREAMLTDDRPRLQASVQRLAELAPISALWILDRSGKVHFSSQQGDIDRVLSPAAPGCVTCHRNGTSVQAESRALRFTDASGRRIWRTIHRIAIEAECQRCHTEAIGSLAGVLIADLDDGQVHSRIEADNRGIFWGLPWLIGGLMVAVAYGVRRHVIARLRGLSHLVDLLRTGARASMLSVGSADEIDELTRNVQALTWELDARMARERALRRAAVVLERCESAALLVDAQGYICAANAAATERLLAHRPGTLIGLQRSACAQWDPAVAAEAERVGWALGEPGTAALVAMTCAGHPHVRLLLEVWADEPANPGLAVDVPVFGHRLDWAIHGIVITESLRAVPQDGATVMRFDQRLARARRLAGQLTAMAQAASADREPIDIDSLLVLGQLDAQRQLPDRRWTRPHCPATQVVGVRYQLRALVDRLCAAAGAQAGSGGEVLLFHRRSVDGREVYVCAWANRAGGEVLLDGPDGPPLARTIACAHEGAVEVDGAFDASTLTGSDDGPRLGTLYAASLKIQSVGRHGRQQP